MFSLPAERCKICRICGEESGRCLIVNAAGVKSRRLDLFSSRRVLCLFLVCDRPVIFSCCASRVMALLLLWASSRGVRRAAARMHAGIVLLIVSHPRCCYVF